MWPHLKHRVGLRRPAEPGATVAEGTNPIDPQIPPRRWWGQGDLVYKRLEVAVFLPKASR